MKHGSVLSVLLLLASVAYLANGARWNQEPTQQLSDEQVAILAQSLPNELRDLYDRIVDPNVDEINRENNIWRGFELLRYRKYRRYSWFYYWLLDISGSNQQQVGRQTPRGQGGQTPGGRTPPKLGGQTPPNIGGRTPPNIGGRTPPNIGGRTPPNIGGRTPPNIGGRTPPNIGGRTPLNIGGRTPRRGGQRQTRGQGRRNNAL